jgi:catechol 2,3-dioxygenase
MSIHPNTTLGAVHLTVSNLSRSLKFYQERLGFKLHRQSGNMAYLGAGKADLLVLTENPNAVPTHRTAGLYHFAVLHPSRVELAKALYHLAVSQTPLQGASDHLVSEAIYLPDPDGNGIEIYRDRPRSDWYYPTGEMKMGTEPLDLENLITELQGYDGQWVGLHPDTVIGHMHLHVSYLEEAEDFYHGVLGFDKIMRYGSMASFLSAGGYHHHIGINTWAGIGAPPQPENAVGLRWFTIHLPHQDELDAIIARVESVGTPVEQHPEGIFLRDPSHNGIVLKINS